MSVHEETYPDGTLCVIVRWRQGGRNRSKRFNAARLGGKKAARDAARRFDGQMAELQALGDVAKVDRGRITFAEYVDEWLDRPAFTRLADSTQDSYADLLDRRLLPAFGSWALRDIHPADVEQLVSRLQRQKVGNPSILRTLAVLQSILKRAVVDRHLEVNPVAQVDKPKQQVSRGPRPIAPVYVERIRLALREQGQAGDALLVCVLAYAGPTPEGEALPLERTAVRKRTLLVPGNLRHKRERTVPIEDPLARDLAEWLLQLPTDQRLLLPFVRRAVGAGPMAGHVGPTGGAWDGEAWDRWRDRVFRPAAIQAGLPADTRPRDLRGSYATLLIHAGHPITEVARRVGHSAQTCLKHYGSVFEEFDPAERVPAAEAIQRARKAALFPPGSQEEKAALAATG